MKKRDTQKKHSSTKHTKALVAALLSKRIGYLTGDDFPDQRLFNELHTRTYAPHRIIRSKEDELFILRRGMVEVWHTHHDILVKKLTTGMLFGEMHLLGQTMITTQSQASDAGAVVAIMNMEQVKELIAANALPLAEKLYPRLV